MNVAQRKFFPVVPIDQVKRLCTAAMSTAWAISPEHLEALAGHASKYFPSERSKQ